MMSLVHNAPSAIQFIMLVSCAILGLSHIVKPAMWVDIFTHFHGMGTRGVIYRTFVFELWPAMAIVTLHQVWWGPGILLTIYGWAQLAKVTVSMLMPEVGLRSMAMAKRGDRALVYGGVMLFAVGASAGAALIWS